MDRLQSETERIIEASGNITGAVQLHAEILSHLAERFRDLRGRSTTIADRHDLLKITNTLVDEFFKVGIAKV